MRVACVLLVLAAACGSEPSAPVETTPEHHAAPAPPPPRASEAPSIAWVNRSFEVHGLPAIAAAGEIAVLPLTEPSHETPNLRLEVRGADDKILEALPILAPTDPESLAHDEKPSPALAARIAAVNAKLATLHGVHDLRPLRPLAVEPAHGGEDPHWATGDNLDIEWRDHHLRVFRHNATQALVDRDGTSWAAATGPECAGRNPAYLGGVYHVAPGTTQSVAGTTLVIAIAYSGDDACEEPGNQLHVISWVGPR